MPFARGSRALAEERKVRDLIVFSDPAGNRLEVFLAENATGSFGKPEEARRDPAYLLDCLEDDDVRVRQAAREALEALGHAVEFDPAADEKTRDEQLSRVRPVIEKTIKPTTQKVRG